MEEVEPEIATSGDEAERVVRRPTCRDQLRSGDPAAGGRVL